MCFVYCKKSGRETCPNYPYWDFMIKLDTTFVSRNQVIMSHPTPGVDKFWLDVLGGMIQFWLETCRLRLIKPLEASLSDTYMFPSRLAISSLWTLPKRPNSLMAKILQSWAMVEQQVLRVLQEKNCRKT